MKKEKTEENKKKVMIKVEDLKNLRESAKKVKELEKKAKKMEEEVISIKDKYVRTLADFDNYKKRV
ncbi:MAG: nucleotide exchange factor GrpE, partial [Candidatus Ratteibacteria bacterium]|nr:nucleotide exchange factor GrpE [Candidatus Ratteibacteria bacterium]